MSALFEELDYEVTPLGVLSLRRRRDLATGADVHEVLLGEDYLMSSRFTAAEIALAELGLDACPERPLHVVVGGLGLGYTARAALEHRNLDSLLVVEGLAAVIGWHEAGLVPLGPALAGDRRCRFVHGDFFALNEDPGGFDPEAPGRRFDAVLVDIDHSPANLLHPDNGRFYTPEGLRQLRTHLTPGGVFALWSNDPPEAGFLKALRSVFTGVETRSVSFPALAAARTDANTVYLARG